MYLKEHFLLARIKSIHDPAPLKQVLLVLIKLVKMLLFKIEGDQFQIICGQHFFKYFLDVKFKNQSGF